MNQGLFPIFLALVAAAATVLSTPASAGYQTAGIGKWDVSSRKQIIERMPNARGIDQTDLLLGKRQTGRDHFDFNKVGVRQGKWKYLKPDAHFHGDAVDSDRPQADELYDLENDLGGRTNLATKHPEIVAEL